MGDEVGKREPLVGDEADDGGEIVGTPLCSDAQTRFAEEGRRKRESEGSFVKSRQNDFAARRQSRN